MTLAQELWHWLVGLDPSFAFLLGLPFMVAAAGMLRFGFDRWDQRRSDANQH